MILVLLGTQDNDFSRLLKEIDNLINIGIIKDKVLVQSGYTQFISNNMEIIDFVSISEFNILLGKADLVITHRWSWFNCKQHKDEEKGNCSTKA